MNTDQIPQTEEELGRKFATFPDINKRAVCYVPVVRGLSIEPSSHYCVYHYLRANMPNYMKKSKIAEHCNLSDDNVDNILGCLRRAKLVEGTNVGVYYNWRAFPENALRPTTQLQKRNTTNNTERERTMKQREDAYLFSKQLDVADEKSSEENLEPLSTTTPKITRESLLMELYGFCDQLDSLGIDLENKIHALELFPAPPTKKLEDYSDKELLAQLKANPSGS